MTEQVTSADYRQRFDALLPQGPAWPRDAGTSLQGLLDGMAEEYARVHNRDLALLEEMNPVTTLEMLPDWERVAGLPDECTCTGDTIDQRRRALLAKLASTGGQTPQYYVDLAAIFGWEITITEHRRFRAGKSAAGDSLTNDDGSGDGWVHVWTVKSDSPVYYFRAGGAAAGEPLSTWGNDPLECLLSRWKPAHTFIVFDYT